MQEITSKYTSVNTSQLPSIWRKLNYRWLNTHLVANVVDYGCGRKATQNKVFSHLLDNLDIHHRYFPYDPYWGDEDRNRNALSCLLTWKEADLCVCANVLNVIEDASELYHIIQEVSQAKYWVFQIYEGDKSGKGKQTKVDCWQRNSKTEWYAHIIRMIVGVSPAIYIKGNLITNSLEILK